MKTEILSFLGTTVSPVPSTIPDIFVEWANESVVLEGNLYTSLLHFVWNSVLIFGLWFECLFEAG